MSTSAAAIRRLLDDARQALAAGRLDEAASRADGALAAAPTSAEARFLKGLVLIRQGRAEEAVAALSAAAAVERNNATYAAELGVALVQAGRAQEAIETLRRAVRLDPSHALAWSNLGAALVRLGGGAEAVQACERAVLLRRDASTLTNLAAALRGAGRSDDALRACREAVALGPRHVSALLNLGQVLLDRGEVKEAVEAYRRATAAAPAHAAAHHALGFALDRLGDRAGAIAAYERAVALRDEPAWRFELAAMRGDPPPAAADPHYVRALFDQEAATLDEKLRTGLAYRVPELLLAAVQAAAGDANATSRAWDVLDLGCGTGLAGMVFRPLARTLTGVDLCPAMVERASARGGYDEVRVADVVEALAGGAAARFDLILAADVFVYLGDLAPVFAAAARALRPGGLFAFSTERHDGPQAYVLSPATRRYAHAERCLRRLAEECGLAVVSLDAAPLRREGDADVIGWIAVLRRPPAPAL